MASRFIPPPNRLNQISGKKAKRSFSDDSGQSIFHELKKNVRDKFTTDAFESVGQMNAVVVEVIDKPIDNILWRNPLMSYLKEEKGVIPDYIEIRFRIPELHAHLPEPENAEDWAAINRHPKALMTKDKSIPTPGDIVTIDFTDKNNFSGAIVTATLNSDKPPGGGGVCKTADAFASGLPALNLAQPLGDAQEAPEGSEEIETDSPAAEGETEGIEMEKEEPPFGFMAERLIYLISINEFNTMPEFSNAEQTFDTLVRKEVFNICFTIANGKKRIKDLRRFKKIMLDLNSKGIKTGLMMRQDYDDFMDNYIFLTNLIKEVEPKYFINHYTNETATQAANIDSLCSQISKSTEKSNQIIQYAYFNHETAEEIYDSELLNVTSIFASRYHYDFNKEKAGEPTPANRLYNSVNARYLRSAYSMGGINFLKTPNDPCFFGERSEIVFKSEFEYRPYSVTLMDDFSRLEKGILAVVKKTMDLTDEQKQNFLSRNAEVEKKEKAEVKDNTEAVIEEAPVEQPVDNTPSLEDDGTADPNETAPVENNAAPGLQCMPFPGGGLPNPVGNGEAVQPPTLRFSEIPNYQQLGWTTDADKGVTNVILQFMNRFTSAYYRRIPMNDPINTGSAHKKIRVTSTLRTASKQVYLMWDKMDKLGENGVWSLYGSSRQWVRDVVAEWKKHKAGDTMANARAVASVQANIDKGMQTGKRGHNYGSGVDIHTWSHLKAEGQPYKGVSETQMKNTRFIKAVVEAAIEAGGKPIVEAYQQHVHITIL